MYPIFHGDSDSVPVIARWECRLDISTSLSSSLFSSLPPSLPLFSSLPYPSLPSSPVPTLFLLVVVVFFFWDLISSPGWPQTHNLLKWWDYRLVCHCTWLSLLSLKAVLIVYVKYSNFPMLKWCRLNPKTSASQEWLWATSKLTCLWEMTVCYTLF
jgi:hypothetical protein